MMLTIWRRVRAWIHRRRMEEELRDEIAWHVDMRRQALIADGMDPADAQSAASRAFGNRCRVVEETTAQWRFHWLDAAVQDIRYGARLLCRTPWFTAVTVLSLAVGIGSTAAVFNVVDGVLFRTLAVSAPDELREFRVAIVAPGVTKVLGWIALDVLAEMQRRTEFAAVLGFRTVDDVRVAGASEHVVSAELVTANYFDVLGVSMRAGRMPNASDVAGTPIPVVVSERLWRAAFGGGVDAVGRTVNINGVAAQVTGITRSYRGLIPERPADLFVPMIATPQIEPAAATLGAQVVVRMRPGVTLSEAEQRLGALFKQLNPPSMAPDALRFSLPEARLGVSDARGSLRRPLLLALVLAGMLLLIACANTGGLLMTRYASRQGEFAVRMAIGAGRGRVARQLAVEALLLAAMAAVAGLIAAASVAPLLLAAIPLGSAPPGFDIRFDWRLIAFTTGVSAAAALVAATASVSRLFRSDPARSLNAHARSVVRGRRRATEALMAAQVACSMLLLVAAGAMTRTLLNLQRVDPGFVPGAAIAVSVDASGVAARPAGLGSFFSDLQRRLESSPLVERVSFAQMGLLTRGSTTGTIEIAGGPDRPDADRLVRQFWIGPDFLETAGMRLLLGRSIGRQESASRERVAVVNQEFARFYFGSADAALGRTVNRDIRIVGIVADARYNTLRDEPVRAMFLPHTQAPPRSTMTFVVRPAGGQGQAAGAVVAALREFEPRLKVRATPLADLRAATLSRERFVAIIAAVLSAFAIFLACAGLYAAAAFAVSERRGEMAVRLALGATAWDMRRLVLAGPLRTMLIGIAVGIPGTYAVMKGLSNLLFGVAPFDVRTIAASALVLTVITVAATLVPARRAGAIDPQECLRCS